MTVMPSGSDVADKAVSTEDASEMVHLDAVLAVLVETKIKAIKRASLSSSRGKWPSAPASPRRPRLMSSSTASSSQNRNHQDHFDIKHFDRGDMEQRRKSYRHRRYDSAPCQQFIDEIDGPGQQGHQNAIADKESKARRRASEMIHRNPKKKRRYSRRISSHVLQGIDSPIELPELLDVDRLHDDLTLIHYERTREALSDNGDFPSIHQSAYVSQSAAHLKLAYEDEDYVALNLEDEFDGASIVSGHYPRDLPRDRRDTLGERYHRPRQKHKRKKHRHEVFLPEVNDVPQVVVIDHDELPLRARWTIVATACLLFAMSLLLVGVTLRMAPIIDDMVRKENEELLNSLNRDTSVPDNSTTAPL
ncbi:uncharacterized protein LOC107040598 [Diachasma alloeum]|uniref:uncharacterized protein LOC107040598 n=1 Tax=Diachasma alloeum TaxID=454923 RepID=UPI00073816A4|nr:uncharacterized protein LOC107040598 [Diachasma alloeum]